MKTFNLMQTIIQTHCILTNNTFLFINNTAYFIKTYYIRKINGTFKMKCGYNNYKQTFKKSEKY